MSLNSTYVPLSGSPDIDPLLSGQEWETPVLTFGFPEAASAWTGYPAGSEPFGGFRSLQPAQRQAVQQALGEWAQVAALSFVPAAEPGQTAELRFAGSTGVASAHTYYPNPSPLGGDAWFGTRLLDAPVWQPGTYEFATALHEAGHALGLKHPHDTDIGGAVADPAADSLVTSVMSYRSAPGVPLSSSYTVARSSYPTGPMLDDIAAVQYLYGPNYAANAGDTVYRFTPDQGVVFQTIWDGGGVDTYDLSAYATDLTVNLNPGQWSTFSSAQFARLNVLAPSVTPPGNVANAFLFNGDPRALIENVIGGAGNDTIVGNIAGNTIVGNGGADHIVLSPTRTVDHVTYAGADDGSAPGVPAGFDVVSNFEPGIDKLVLAGTVRLLADHNGDWLLSGGPRAPGQINLGTDEAVLLTARLGALADTEFASVRAAIGPLQGGTTHGTLLALGSDGVNSGLYLIGHANDDGQLAGTDVRLLALAESRSVGLGDLMLA